MSKSKFKTRIGNAYSCFGHDLIKPTPIRKVWIKMIMFKVGKTKNGKPIHRAVQSLFSNTLIPKLRLAWNCVPPNLGNINKK